jgi:hypothetical protein
MSLSIKSYQAFVGTNTYPKEIQISNAHNPYVTTIPQASIMGREAAMVIATTIERIRLAKNSFQF